jgi:cobalt-zinc-cadmium efflux system outer membrane protein
LAQGGPDITLEQAVDAALAGRPELAAFPHEIRAAEGRAIQASLRPNPEVEVEFANVGGNLPGTSRSETTVGLNQRMETAGKRQARINNSRAEIEVLRRDYEALRLTVTSDVRSAFVTLLGAQRRLALAGEARGIADRLAEAAAAQVAAGAVSPIEETRARATAATAAGDVLRAERDAIEARLELAAAMGVREPGFASAAGDLPEDLHVPPLDPLLRRLPQTPALARWEAEQDRRRAALAAAKTRAVPDVTLGGFYRRLQEDRENTFVLGFSAPFPFFDRNQGAIREAEAELARTEPDRRTAEIALGKRLAQRHAALVAAVREAATLKEGALVYAQAAYEAVNEGYRLGKFRYLDVLDAGKALVEARLRYVETLINLNQARIEIERLTGSIADRSGPTIVPEKKGDNR